VFWCPRPAKRGWLPRLGRWWWWWWLLPPLTFACPQLSVAGVLEPAYEVAGDTFDYAVDPGVANLAVFDGVGHGLRSAQLAVVAVAAYRHARRAGRSLGDICEQIDQVLMQTSGGQAFSTAGLAQLDTISGALRWVNAGHALGQRRPPGAAADPSRTADQVAARHASPALGNRFAWHPSFAGAGRRLRATRTRG
jgi:hypothetical protein